MKIKEIQERLVKTEVVKEILCNCCEKNITPYNDKQVVTGGTITFDFGYGSGFDGDFRQGHVCDACFEKINALFKIKIQDINDL